MHWKEGNCKIHNAQRNQRMGITSNSCSSHRMLLDSTTHFRLRTNSSLSKNCIHEVYMEIISDCVVDEPLWPLLRFPLVSEHHIIVPSSTHAYSHPKPSLERISRIEEQRIRVNHLLAIESRLHLRLFFLLTVNPTINKITCFCLASSFSFFTRSSSFISKAVSSSLCSNNERNRTSPSRKMIPRCRSHRSRRNRQSRRLFSVRALVKLQAALFSLLLPFLHDCLPRRNATFFGFDVLRRFHFGNHFSVRHLLKSARLPHFQL